MNLKINQVADKGTIEKERLVLEATADVPDLMDYIVTDNTFVGPNQISNEWRHDYRFLTYKKVKKGDLVVLYTKAGTNSSQASKDQKYTLHFFYWGLGKTIWNKDGDGVTLFQIADWATLRV